MRNLYEKFIAQSFKTAEQKSIFFLSFAFYLTSSIGLTLATKTIGYWLYDNHFSYTFIGFITSLLHLPYSLRIIFVPWLEFLQLKQIKNWGYRKSLIFWLNILSILCIFVIGFVGLSNLWIFLMMCFVCSMVNTAMETTSSSYFMSTYSSEMKSHWVTGGQIGYNIGLYITYTFIMALSYWIPWNFLYMGCIFFLSLNLFFISYAKNCEFERLQQPNVQKVYFTPIKLFFQKHKEYFRPLVIFSLFYRAPDKIIGPLLPLLFVSVFGKLLAAVLKTISLLAMMIGSFGWTYIKKENPVDNLIIISRLHVSNIAVFAALSVLYLYTNNVYLLLLIGASGFLMKAIRTMESAAIFAYQCSLYDNKHFGAQSSMGNLADKAFGDILASFSGLVKDLFGWGVFFGMAVIAVTPSWIAAKSLRKYKQNLS